MITIIFSCTQQGPGQTTHQFKKKVSYVKTPWSIKYIHAYIASDQVSGFIQRKSPKLVKCSGTESNQIRLIRLPTYTLWPGPAPSYQLPRTIPYSLLQSKIAQTCTDSHFPRGLHEGRLYNRVFPPLTNHLGTERNTWPLPRSLQLVVHTHILTHLIQSEKKKKYWIHEPFTIIP